LIRQALRHLHGIGPKRCALLEAEAITCWDSILEINTPPPGFGPETWLRIQAHVRLCVQALEHEDWPALIREFETRDHWRILARHADRASYFDIETSGMEADSVVTLIVCYHQGRLHRFLRGENLDHFLDLLEEVELLVSFNGTTFDVPRVESAFHIPALPCPHVDLRWMCYHLGMSGGLKPIETRMGIKRPADLEGVGGEEAVWLWHRWDGHRDDTARRELERYCCADVLTLRIVAAHVLQAHGVAAVVPDEESMWRDLREELPPLAAPTPPAPSAPSAPITPSGDAPARAERVRDMKRNLRRHLLKHGW
jgi:uncharacterized protein YprB with RNaseH-like and TPR domain